MITVFLSFHDDAANHGLAATVDLVDTHALRATTGDVLAGGNLTPEAAALAMRAEADRTHSSPSCL
jgi:hypothetical protein